MATTVRFARSNGPLAAGDAVLAGTVLNQGCSGLRRRRRKERTSAAALAATSADAPAPCCEPTLAAAAMQFLHRRVRRHAKTARFVTQNLHDRGATR